MSGREGSMDEMEKEIADIMDASFDVRERMKKELVRPVREAAGCLIRVFSENKKLLICGNGGSAADAQHMAAELVGRFEKERSPLPVLALSVNTSVITAWSNDYSFDTVFSRQVEALGRKGDALLAISTSGNSPSVLAALKTARGLGMATIGLSGGSGGKMKGAADHLILVPSQSTPRVQEGHILCIHILCRLVEKGLFS